MPIGQASGIAGSVRRRVAARIIVLSGRLDMPITGTPKRVQ